MPSLVETALPEPCPRPYNLAANVLAAGTAVPGKTALAVLAPDGVVEAIDHASLRSRVLTQAGALARLGLTPGDRVLLRLGNSPAFPIAFLAAIAAGGVPVPSSAQLTEPEVAVLDAALASKLIVASDGIALPPSTGARIVDEAELAALAARAEALEPRPSDPEAPAYIVFTSGTSGRPRGVVHAHRAFWARRMMHAGWYGLGSEDRLLHAGAFNWTFTLGTGLLDPWSVGATALIPAEGLASADLPALLAQHEATLFAAAPGVYRQMLRSSPPPLPRLRHGLSAGEKMASALQDELAVATGFAVHEAFGQSECSTFISGSPARPAPPGTLGYAQPGRRIALLGEDGAPVPRGTPGVIAVAASDPGLMLGYLDAPEATAARFTADGQWYLTGDTGAMEADGAVRYLGRDDDMMNAGGFRVAPAEVEAALTDHPAILEAAAVELTVKAGTRIIAAFYTSETPLSDDTLGEFAAGRLARYKCPRRFIRLDALPRGANGKLLRRSLRERYGRPDDPA